MKLFLSLLLSLLPLASAQFGGFFDQMFGGGGGEGHGGHGHGHPGQQQPRNNPSDANHYRSTFEQSVCDNYLCPDTLACVHFPHHCPCAWDEYQDKFELGEGKRLCVSRGGWSASDAAKKVELARKGIAFAGVGAG